MYQHPILYDTSLPKVAILLCTYNGGKYLVEQLDSFEAQTHTRWQVWASDDGSTDNTLAILQQYQEKWGSERLVILDGPHAGSTRNFMSLACNRAISANYFAFSDQDDVWESEKLERALAWLETNQRKVPLLYGTRTRFVDEDNKEIGLSQLFQRPPGFRNALVQNFAGGNTMVFNDAARSILGDSTLDVVIHDWWVYLAVSACGGKVQYDAYPSLRYRQHQDNLIGMNSNWQARWTRIRKLFKGDFRAWADKNIAALQKLDQELMPENRELLQSFARIRREPLFTRAASFKHLGLYRQTTLGNLGLVAAVLFNKI